MLRTRWIRCHRSGVFLEFVCSLQDLDTLTIWLTCTPTLAHVAKPSLAGRLQLPPTNSCHANFPATMTWISHEHLHAMAYECEYLCQYHILQKVLCIHCTCTCDRYVTLFEKTYLDDKTSILIYKTK